MSGAAAEGVEGVGGGAITHRRVLAIALPIVLSNATIPLLGMVDTGVVGQLGRAEPIGAVGIGAVILTTLYWVFGFLRMGTSGLVAQARGAGDAAASGAHLLRALAIGVAANLGVLGWFKYYGFFVSSARNALSGIGIEPPLPLLEIVGHPRAVNPDFRLGREARRRGWPVEEWTTERVAV